MSPIILAHAADTQALAANVERRLCGLGYVVERKLVATNLDKAPPSDSDGHRLIVLWSRGAAGANLDAWMRRAQGTGKLSVVRLASSPTPTRFKGVAHRLPRAGSDDSHWRGLVENATPSAPSPESPPRYPGSRLHALLVLVLIGLVSASAAYASNAGFAAKINALFGG